MKKWALVLLIIGVSIIISACNRDIFSVNTKKTSANKAISNTEVTTTKKSFTSSENSTKVQLKITLTYVTKHFIKFHKFQRMTLSQVIG